MLCWGPLDGYNGLSQWGWFSALMDKTLRIQRSPARPDGVNALNFIDFHAYNNGEENANRVVSEIHMVAACELSSLVLHSRATCNVRSSKVIAYKDELVVADAATKFGVHMPCAITETSVALASAANWSNRAYHFTHRTLPRLRQLMALLAHPDKMVTVQEHDLQALAGGYYTFSKSFSHPCSYLGSSSVPCDSNDMAVLVRSRWLFEFVDQLCYTRNAVVPRFPPTAGLPARSYRQRRR